MIIISLFSEIQVEKQVRKVNETMSWFFENVKNAESRMIKKNTKDSNYWKQIKAWVLLQILSK